MRAAIATLHEAGPSRIVVAVPVGAGSTCAQLEDNADEVIYAHSPDPFHAVGDWYRDFSQTTDEEVHDLLGQIGQDRAAASAT
jgi:predicted phosphoribosyltransferase